MKKFFLILICFTFLISAFKENGKKRIIFFGDSITEGGVSTGGYIRNMDSILRANKRDKKYELVGAGNSGDKVTNLYLRMENDVLLQKPDAVVIWIGVNDVWHKKSGTGTDETTFISFYNEIIRKLKAIGIIVFMCTPAVIGEKDGLANPLDDELNKYSDLIREIASKNN